MSDNAHHPLSQGQLTLLLLVTVFIGFFLALGSVPLFDVDEGAFSEATREMFLRGDFLSTYLYGEPRHDKPILSYWLQAISIGLYGFHEWGFRLPSALMATGWVAAVFVFTLRVRHNLELAYAAAMMTASVVLIVIIGRAATADALLNVLIALTMFSLYRYVIGHGLLHLYFAAAAAGLGFLAKGPVAVAIPAIVSGLWFLSQRDLKGWLGLAAHWRAWVLFALIAFPWYGVQYLRDGGAFFNSFFLDHNVGRFSNAMETHSGPFWYYVPILLIGLLPFTGFILRALTQVRTRWADPLDRFLLIWFGFIFLFFSFSGTKLPHYVLYGVSGLLIFSAPELLKQRNRATNILLWSPLPLAAAFMAVLPALLGMLASDSMPAHDREIMDALLAEFTWPYYAVLAISLPLSYWLLWTKQHHALLKTAVAGISVSFFVVIFLMPIAANVQQQPVKEAAIIARSIDAPTVLWRLHRPSFPIYAQRMVERRDPQPGELVFTKSKERHELPPGKVLYEKNGLALVLLNPKQSQKPKGQ